MLKVMLVNDDYNELIYTQTLLRKLGFDTDGIQNSKKFEEAFLGFNADVVLIAVKGKRTDGLRILTYLCRRQAAPAVILLKNPGLTIDEQTRSLPLIKGIITSPINVRELLTRLAQVGDLDVEVLLDKFVKMRGTLSQEVQGSASWIDLDGDDISTDEDDEGLEQSEAPQETSGELNPSLLSDQERRKRFQQYIAQTETPKTTHFSRERIMELNREIRATEGKDLVEDLEEERRSFVKALFKKS